MISRLGLALLALAPTIYPAASCPNGVDVVRLSDEKILVSVQADAFELVYRHSVTLTPVVARYELVETGIVQTEERFSAHGPGIAHDGEGWHIENDVFILPLRRPIDRLILRAAPQYENQLIAADAAIDLYQWPRTPLEIRPLTCGNKAQ